MLGAELLAMTASIRLIASAALLTTHHLRLVVVTAEVSRGLRRVRCLVRDQRARLGKVPPVGSNSASGSGSDMAAPPFLDREVG